MKIVATVDSSKGKHGVTLQTNGNAHSLTIAPKTTGFGSGTSGGELLFLALATCYCNDIYREAAQRNIKMSSVQVTVEGEFGAAGQPARNITYSAKVCAEASESDIRELMKHTDTVAEIQNTLRSSTPVRLHRMEAQSL